MVDIAQQKKISIDPWLFGVVVFLLFAIYASTFFSFYNVFSEEGSGQSHAPLLLVVSLYLVYWAWKADRHPIKIQVSVFFALLMVVASLSWLAAGLVFVEAMQQVSLILMLALVIVAMLGYAQGRRYLVPVLLLLSLLPVWNVLVPYLQMNSAVLSTNLLQLSGLTATREGYLILIPGGSFEVADECSGLKFLVVSVSLAVIHSQIARVGVKDLIIYMIVAALLALVSNAIRIYIVVLIGYLEGMDHALVRDHNNVGWIVFALLILPLLIFAERILRKRGVKNDALTESDEQRRGVVTNPVIGSILVVLSFSLGPGLLTYFDSVKTNAIVDHVKASSDMGGWHKYSSQLEEWKPLWTEGDRSLQGRFNRGDDFVDLFATQFLKQEDGHEAVNISHRVYDIKKWSRISRSAKVIPYGESGTISLEETLLKSIGNKRRLVWQWYRTNDNFVQGDVKAKLNNLVGTLKGRPDITVYILSKEIVKDEENAVSVLSDFVDRYVQI